MLKFRNNTTLKISENKTLQNQRKCESEARVKREPFNPIFKDLPLLRAKSVNQISLKAKMFYLV